MLVRNQPEAFIKHILWDRKKERERERNIVGEEVRVFENSKTTITIRKLLLLDESNLINNKYDAVTESIMDLTKEIFVQNLCEDKL